MQPAFSLLVGRMLSVIAILLAIDCYLLHAWSATPRTVPWIETLAATLALVGSDPTLQTVADPAALPFEGATFIDDLAIGVGVMAMIIATSLFAADGVVRVGAWFHRAGVRRAVRRLSGGIRRPEA